MEYDIIQRFVRYCIFYLAINMQHEAICPLLFEGAGMCACMCECMCACVCVGVGVSVCIIGKFLQRT